MRYLAYISYDGSDFFGFAISVGKRTIQEEIEKALRILTKKDIKIYASGRTDAKVHAINQALHFDLDFSIKEDGFVEGINKILTPEIRFNNLTKVSDDFHARYSVKTKEYRYLIKLSKPTVFESRYESLSNLSLELMYKTLMEVELIDLYPKNKCELETIAEMLELDNTSDIETIAYGWLRFEEYMVGMSRKQFTLGSGIWKSFLETSAETRWQMDRSYENPYYIKGGKAPQARQQHSSSRQACALWE